MSTRFSIGKPRPIARVWLVDGPRPGIGKRVQRSDRMRDPKLPAVTVSPATGDSGSRARVLAGAHGGSACATASRAIFRPKSMLSEMPRSSG